MANFQDLPNELVVRIIRFLDKQSLAQVRFVNRRLDQISVEQLFARIALYAHWKEKEPPPKEPLSPRSFFNRLFPDERTVNDDGWDPPPRRDPIPYPPAVNRDGDNESSWRIHWPGTPGYNNSEAELTQDGFLPDPPMAINENQEAEYLLYDSDAGLLPPPPPPPPHPPPLPFPPPLPHWPVLSEDDEAELLPIDLFGTPPMVNEDRDYEPSWSWDDPLPDLPTVNEDEETGHRWIDPFLPGAHIFDSPSEQWVTWEQLDQLRKERGLPLNRAEPRHYDESEEEDPSWKTVIKSRPSHIPGPEWASEGFPGPPYDAQMFKNVLGNSFLRQLVKEVHIYTCKTDCNLNPMHAVDWYNNSGSLPRPVFDATYIECIKQLGEFTNLSHIAVHFDRYSAGTSGDIYAKDLFQTSTFKSLWLDRILQQVDAQRIKQLGVRHYDNTVESKNKLPSFIEKATNLNSLRLNIVHEEFFQSQGCTLTDGFIHSFWNTFPKQILAPKQQSLTTLVLYSDLPLGWYPKLDLRKIHFKQLQSLTLGHHVFHHNHQIDWIMSHSSTLEELNLDRCSILYSIGHSMPHWLDEDGYPSEPDRYFGGPSSLGPMRGQRDEFLRKLRFVPSLLRWHDIFSRFTELPALQEFRFGSSKQWKMDTYSRHHLRYESLIGHPVMPWEDEKNIKNEILKSRYMIYDDFQVSYRRKWLSEQGRYCRDFVHDQIWRKECKVQFEEYPDCKEADQAALQALLDKIRGR